MATCPDCGRAMLSERLDVERLARALYSVGWIGIWLEGGMTVPFDHLTKIRRWQVVRSTREVLAEYARLTEAAPLDSALGEER